MGEIVQEKEPSSWRKTRQGGPAIVWLSREHGPVYELELFGPGDLAEFTIKSTQRKMAGLAGKFENQAV